MDTDTLIIGGGPTGLSAAFHLGNDYLLVEKEPQLGGLCKSITDSEFTFDYAGHILFTSDEYVLNTLYPMLLGSNIHWQNREAWIYSRNVYTRYPFQAATYGLPVDVVKDCIIGVVEALHSPRDSCVNNFHDFILRNWGSGIARHFMLPYNQKLWAVPLEEMGYSWLKGRVPIPDLAEIVDGALRPQPKPMGPNARFGYPLLGGFGALIKGWLGHLDLARLRVGWRVDEIDPIKCVATSSEGASIRYPI
jgi:UDP-galactopyranose mutase